MAPMARGYEYTAEVSVDTPETVEALAKRLRETCAGSLRVGVSKALALTMAYAYVNGCIHGGWGCLRWNESPDSDYLGHRKITWVWQ